MAEPDRDLTANASHELRTPLTSLRLSLEDLALWPGVAAPVRAELRRLVAEVEVLSDRVSALLGEAAEDQVGSPERGTAALRVLLLAAPGPTTVTCEEHGTHTRIGVHAPGADLAAAVRTAQEMLTPLGGRALLAEDGAALLLPVAADPRPTLPETSV